MITIKVSNPFDQGIWLETYSFFSLKPEWFDNNFARDKKEQYSAIFATSCVL